MKNLALLAVGLLLGISSVSAQQNREALTLDPNTIKVENAPKNLQLTAMEGGGVKLTYDNSDFAAKREIVIRRALSPAMTVTRAGFELNPGIAQKVQFSCLYPDKKWSETWVDSQGSVISEYMADFAAIASARKIAPQEAVLISLRIPVAKEPGEQVIELKSIWVEKE